MKKIKLAAVITALILSVTVFTACGKDRDEAKNKGGPVAVSWDIAEFSEVFKTKYINNDEKIKKLTATKLNDFSNYDDTAYSFMSDFSGSVKNSRSLRILSLLDSATGATDYVIYNFALDKVVYRTTLAAGENVDATLCARNIYGDYWYYAFKIVKTKDGSFESEEYYSFNGMKFNGYPKMTDVKTIYNDDNEVTSYVINVEVTDEDSNVTKFSFDAYSFKELAVDNESPVGNEFKEFKEKIDMEGKAYDYRVESKGVIFVYEKGTAKVVRRADFTGAYENVIILPLSNETFLVQLTRETDGDYDYLMINSGEAYKYDLKSYIYDPAADTRTEVRLDYIIADVTNEFTDKEYGDKYKCENIAEAVRIENKVADGKLRHVVLKNNLEIGGVIDNYVIEQKGLPELISDGIFSVNGSGRTKYLDGTGKVIGEMVTDYNILSKPFISTEQSIYNRLTLNKVIDFNTDEYTVEVENDNFNNTVILKKTYISSEKVEFLLLTPDSDTPKSLFFGGDNVYYRFDVDGYYSVRVRDDVSGVYTFTYGNSNGEKLFSYKNSDDSAFMEYQPAYVTMNERVYIMRFESVDDSGAKTLNYYRTAF